MSIKTKEQLLSEIKILKERLSDLDEALQNKNQLPSKTLMSNLPGMAYRCANDAEWTMHFVSEGCSKLTGYLPEEILHNTVISYNNIIHPDDREHVRQTIDSALEINQTFSVAYRIQTAQSQMKWVWEQGTALFDENGVFTFLEGFVSDITNQVESEKAIKETTGFLNSIIENIPDMVFIKDAKELRFLLVNKKTETLLGYSRDELLGKDDYNFFPKKEADFFTTNDRQVLESGLQLDIPEESVHTRELGERILHTKKIPLLDDDGKPLYLLGISEDITDLKGKEKEIEKLKIRFERALENIPEVLVIYDHERRIRFINNATQKLTGRTTSDFIGKLDEEVWPPEIYKNYMHTLEAAYETGETQTIETELDFNEIGKRILRITCIPLINIDGAVEEVMGITYDLTENRTATAALMKSEEQYRQITKNLVDVVWILDLSLNFTYISPSVYQMTGYTQEEFIGSNLAQHTSRREFIKMSGEAFKAIKDYKNFKKVTFSTKILKKDGTSLPVEISGKLVINEKGFPIGLQGSTRDITERLLVKNKLIESEKQFRELFEFMTAGFVLFEVVQDEKGNPIDLLILAANKGFENTAKQKIPDVIGKHLTQVLPGIKNDKADWIGIFSQVAITGESRQFQQGSELLKQYYSINAYQSGSMKCAVTFTDITERKRAEKLLLESEERYRNLVNTSPFAIATHQDGVITYVNPATLILLGAKVEADLLGKPITDIVHPDHLDNAISRVQRTFSGEKGLYPTEEVYLRLDGSVVNVEVAATPLILNDKPAMQVIALDIEDRKKSEQKLIDAHENLAVTLEAIIQTIAATVEARDPYTSGHQKRVADLAVEIAKQLGLSQDQIQGLRMAGIIHDFGKIQIPSEILNRPGKLTDLEFRMIQTHPEVGYRLIKDIDFPWPLPQIILQHHEKMNGSGYPQGLREDEILLEARILTVADIVEAMASHRPYRPALGIDQALTQIKKDSGGLLDPVVVNACLKIFSRGYKFPGE